MWIGLAWTGKPVRRKRSSSTGIDPEEDGRRGSRFGRERPVGVPKEHEAGAATAALCHQHGSGEALRRDSGMRLVPTASPGRVQFALLNGGDTRTLPADPAPYQRAGPDASR